MEYVDKKGTVYEISYSQKLQAEANRIARQKNQLLYAILIVISLFGFALFWVLIRLSHANFLTHLISALGTMG